MACEIVEVTDGLVVTNALRSVVVPWADIPRLVLNLDKLLRAREVREHLANHLELGKL